jgi:hypothetical protein
MLVSMTYLFYGDPVFYSMLNDMIIGADLQAQPPVRYVRGKKVRGGPHKLQLSLGECNDDICSRQFRILQVPGRDPEFVNFLRIPGINSQTGGPVRHLSSTFRPDRLHKLAESIPSLCKCLQIRALQNVCFFRRNPALRDYLPVLALGQTVLPRYGEEGTVLYPHSVVL